MCFQLLHHSHHMWLIKRTELFQEQSAQLLPPQPMDTEIKPSGPDHLLVMVHKISAIHVSSTDWTGQHITPSFHWTPVSCDRALGRHYRMLLLPIMPSFSEVAG